MIACVSYLLLSRARVELSVNTLSIFQPSDYRASYLRLNCLSQIIVVPETITREEYIDEVQKITETIIEVAKPVIQEKIIEVHEIEYRDKIIEVIEKVHKEKIREVEKIEYQERIVEVPRIITREKIVEVSLFLPWHEVLG